MEVALDADPETEIVKRYTDGSSIRNYRFAIRSAGSYGADVLQQISNSGIFESLSEWLEMQTRTCVLPFLPDGREAQAITVQSAGPQIAADAAEGTYQIQCTLQYFQEA